MLKNILTLFYPKTCNSCNRHLSTNEILICLYCRNELNYKQNCSLLKDQLNNLLKGRISYESSIILFPYNKQSTIQKLIHKLKYHNQENIGAFFGEWIGKEIITDKEFSVIDVVIPIPLSKSKLQKRGYNQLTLLGKTIAKNINADFIDSILVKKKVTESQTKKIKFERWLNVKTVFELTNSEAIENKHVLIIDDIITTGATIEAACHELLKIKNVKISIASIALTE